MQTDALRTAGVATGLTALCLAAGGGSHFVLLGLAFVGAWPGIVAAVAAKALIAGAGGYIARRSLRLGPVALVCALCAYEVGPLLMCLWALNNFAANGAFDFNPLPWFVPSIPDVIAARVGYRRASRQVVPPRRIAA